MYSKNSKAELNKILKCLVLNTIHDDKDIIAFYADVICLWAEACYDKKKNIKGRIKRIKAKRI